MNNLAIAILVITLIITLRGMKRGLLKSIFSFISVILAMTITYYCTPYVAAWVTENTEIDETINTYISKQLTHHFTENEDGTKNNLKGRTNQKKALQNSELPEKIQEIITANNNKEFYKAIGADKFQEYVSGYLTGIIINLLSYIILYIICRIVIGAVFRMLNWITKLPVLRGLNRIGGALFGIAKSFLYLCLFFMIVTLISTTEVGKQCYAMIQENEILSELYRINPLMNGIMDITRQLFS